jgi:hypothetical protein
MREEKYFRTPQNFLENPKRLFKILGTLKKFFPKKKSLPKVTIERHLPRLAVLSKLDMKPSQFIMEVHFLAHAFHSTGRRKRYLSMTTKRPFFPPLQILMDTLMNCDDFPQEFDVASLQIL